MLLEGFCEEIENWFDKMEIDFYKQGNMYSFWIPENEISLNKSTLEICEEAIIIQNALKLTIEQDLMYFVFLEMLIRLNRKYPEINLVYDNDTLIAMTSICTQGNVYPNEKQIAHLIAAPIVVLQIIQGELKKIKSQERYFILERNVDVNIG